MSDRRFLANKKYGGQSAKSMLQRALMFIHKNYARDITLEELAEMSGVTKQHFCRVFKESDADASDGVSGKTTSFGCKKYVVSNR